MFRRLRRAQPSLRASFPHIHPRILASLATFLASDTSFLGLRATLRLRLTTTATTYDCDYVQHLSARKSTCQYVVKKAR